MSTPSDAPNKTKADSFCLKLRKATHLTLKDRYTPKMVRGAVSVMNVIWVYLNKKKEVRTLRKTHNSNSTQRLMVLLVF